MAKYKERRIRPEPQGNSSHHTGYKKRVQDLLDENGGERVNGKVASNRTQKLTAITMHSGFNTLHEELGMKLQEPYNLREAHIRALVRHWYYTEDKKVKTMTNMLSIWRKFAGWIGKAGMIKSLPHYLPDVPPEELMVRADGEEEKSWTTNGIDVQAKIDQAFQLNERFGMILLAQLAFGLRMREALCLRPWKADIGSGLNVYPGDGPKGGRPRLINYLTPEQKLVIGFIKQRVKKEHWLGWEFKRRGELATLQSNINEYYARMQEIGVTKKLCGATGHGLRAEFSENMADVKGFRPASKGGTGDQMPWDELVSKVAEVSELLGHSRTSVMASYFGAFKRPSGAAKATYVGLGLASTSAKSIVGALGAKETREDAVGVRNVDDTSQAVDPRLSLADGTAGQKSGTVDKSTSQSRSLAGADKGVAKPKPAVDERQLELPLKGNGSSALC